MFEHNKPEPDASWGSRQGSVAVIVALTLTMLLGFIALGSEIVFALFKQRQMETVASAAALAGATALMTGHPTSPATESQAIAVTGGFTNGSAGVTVTVNNPPKSGPNTGNTTDVEVIVAQPQTLPLSSLFHAGTWNVSGRAVATEGNSASDCVLQLDSSGVTGVTINNGANVDLNSCGLAVNATGSSALSVVGATLNANSVTISGSDSTSNGGTINSTIAVATSQPAVANPYAGTPVPTPSGSMPAPTGSSTINPGTYNGLSIANGWTVALSSGVYIINGGVFSVGGGATVTGTNVTIVLTGSGSNYAYVSISNGVTVTLSAPTTGATAGLVFFADPNSPSTPGSSFQGGASMTLTGALYFPSQTVTFANGTSTNATCTQLIAWLIQFQGGTSFNSNCASTGVSTIGTTPSQLVE